MAGGLSDGLISLLKGADAFKSLSDEATQELSTFLSSNSARLNSIDITSDTFENLVQSSKLSSDVKALLSNDLTRHALGATLDFTKQTNQIINTARSTDEVERLIRSSYEELAQRNRLDVSADDYMKSLEGVFAQRREDIAKLQASQAGMTEDQARNLYARIQSGEKTPGAQNAVTNDDTKKGLFSGISRIGSRPLTTRRAIAYTSLPTAATIGAVWANNQTDGALLNKVVEYTPKVIKSLVDDLVGALEWWGNEKAKTVFNFAANQLGEHGHFDPNNEDQVKLLHLLSHAVAGSPVGTVKALAEIETSDQEAINIVKQVRAENPDISIANPELAILAWQRLVENEQQLRLEAGQADNTAGANPISTADRQGSIADGTESSPITPSILGGTTAAMASNLKEQAQRTTQDFNTRLLQQINDLDFNKGISNAFNFVDENKENLGLNSFQRGFISIASGIAAIASGLSWLFGEEAAQSVQRWALKMTGVEQKVAQLQDDLENGTFARQGNGGGLLERALGILPDNEPDPDLEHAIG